jgi:hypothetical protein
MRDVRFWTDSGSEARSQWLRWGSKLFSTRRPAGQTDGLARLTADA